MISTIPSREGRVPEQVPRGDFMFAIGCFGLRLQVTGVPRGDFLFAIGCCFGLRESERERE